MRVKEGMDYAMFKELHNLLNINLKLDLDRLEREGLDYFKEVKHHHDEKLKILFSEAECPGATYECC